MLSIYVQPSTRRCRMLDTHHPQRASQCGGALEARAPGDEGACFLAPADQRRLEPERLVATLHRGPHKSARVGFGAVKLDGEVDLAGDVEVGARAARVGAEGLAAWGC